MASSSTSAMPARTPAVCAQASSAGIAATTRQGCSEWIDAGSARVCTAPRHSCPSACQESRDWPGTGVDSTWARITLVPCPGKPGEPNSTVARPSTTISASSAPTVSRHSQSCASSK